MTQPSLYLRGVSVLLLQPLEADMLDDSHNIGFTIKLIYLFENRMDVSAPAGRRERAR